MGDSVETSGAKLPIKDQSIQGGRPQELNRTDVNLYTQCQEGSAVRVWRTCQVLEYYTFDELNLGRTHFCNPLFKQNWLMCLSYRKYWHIFCCFH